ncbi:hypothetical protein [Nostoc commune]|uniref:hypothetical protein n=1 Tax=Nostoc commune TaxID=1178 RepID=UPI0018C6C3B8|nr:hypothetical protein [Nostoc commune]MBG1259777.1 hypothetical protein [Nostoc commune BAE]
MCNGWNHSATCDCDFSGGSSGGGGRAGTVLDNIPIRDRILAKKTDEYLKGAETYPTSCWRCGEEVFYHTNGFGDAVLFDSLGSPWRVHSCWEIYWNEEKLKREETKHFNTVKNSSILRTRNGKLFKQLLLKGAIQSIKKEGCLVTEEKVASHLGISLEELRERFSHLYYYSGYWGNSRLIEIKLGVIN